MGAADGAGAAGGRCAGRVAESGADPVRCAALDVEFLPAMLSWPPGPRATDGVWAKHWYDAVLPTTTFQPYRPRTEAVPSHLAGLLEEAEAIYRQLHEHRLGS